MRLVGSVKKEPEPDAVLPAAGLHLSPPLPVGNADRVEVRSRSGSPLFPYPEYRALRDRNQSLEGLAISEPEEPELRRQRHADR